MHCGLNTIQCKILDGGNFDRFGVFTCNCQNFTIQMHHITSHSIQPYVQPPKYYHPNASSSFIHQNFAIYNSNICGSQVYPPIMCITFLTYISVVYLFSGMYSSCIPAFTFDPPTQSKLYKLSLMLNLFFTFYL